MIAPAARDAPSISAWTGLTSTSSTTVTGAGTVLTTSTFFTTVVGLHAGFGCTCFATGAGLHSGFGAFGPSCLATGLGSCFGPSCFTTCLLLLSCSFLWLISFFGAGFASGLAWWFEATFFGCSFTVFVVVVVFTVVVVTVFPCGLLWWPFAGFANAEAVPRAIIDAIAIVFTVVFIVFSLNCRSWICFFPALHLYD